MIPQLLFMNSRFLFYRSSFIINMASVFAFMFLFFTLISKPEYKMPPRLIIILFFVGAVLYLINDLAGLSLIKRVRQQRDISWQIINSVFVIVFIQFIMQLLVAYGLFKVIKLFYGIRQYLHAFFSAINMLPSLIFIAMVIVFFTGSFNIYATLRLMRIAKNNQKENKEMLEILGS